MPALPACAFYLPWPLDHVTGGVNQVMLNLLRQCRASGRWRPLLIENHWDSVRPVWTERHGFDCVRLRIRPLTGSPAVKSTLAAAAHLPSELRTLAKFLRHNGVACANIHFTEIEGANFVFLKRLGWFSGRVTLSFHGSDIRGAHRAGALYRRVYRWALRHADDVVSCSRGLLEEIEALEPTLRNTRVIYNGFGAVPADADAAVRRGEGAEVVASVGRFEYRKGHDLLIEAVRRLRETRPRAELWLIGGEGDHLEPTRAAAAAHPWVRLLVNVPHPQVLRTIAQADVFAFASRWRRGVYGEGFPIALLEAGALGLPVVTTRCCGADELISDGETGRLTPLEDPAALASALADSLTHREQALEMARRLQTRIAREFTWERCWREYEALFSGASVT